MYNILPEHGFGFPELVEEVRDENAPDEEVDEHQVCQENNEDGDILLVLSFETKAIELYEFVFLTID